MRKNIFAFSFLFIAAWAIADSTTEPYRSPPLARDGGIEVVGLNERRHRRAYAVKEAEHEGTLIVELGVFIKPIEKENTGIFLYRFLEFEPVWDELGELLSQQAEIISYSHWGDNQSTDMKKMTDEFAVTGTSEKNGLRGTSFDVVLAAASRKATRIRLTGKLEVIEAKVKTIVIKNIAKNANLKVVDNDVIDTVIDPVVHKGSDFFELSMNVSGKQSRLWGWRMTKDGKEWLPRTASFSGGLEQGIKTYDQVYSEPLPEGVDLELQVVVPLHRTVLPFDLKEIELP